MGAAQGRADGSCAVTVMCTCQLLLSHLPQAPHVQLLHVLCVKPQASGDMDCPVTGQLHIPLHDVTRERRKMCCGYSLMYGVRLLCKKPTTTNQSRSSCHPWHHWLVMHLSCAGPDAPAETVAWASPSCASGPQWVLVQAQPCQVRQVLTQGPRNTASTATGTSGTSLASVALQVRDAGGVEQ